MSEKEVGVRCWHITKLFDSFLTLAPYQFRDYDKKVSGRFLTDSEIEAIKESAIKDYIKFDVETAENGCDPSNFEDFRATSWKGYQDYKKSEGE